MNGGIKHAKRSGYTNAWQFWLCKIVPNHLNNRVPKRTWNFACKTVLVQKRITILLIQKCTQAFKKQGTKTNGGIYHATWSGNTNVPIHNVQNVKNNRTISNKGVLTRSGAVISLIKFMQKSTTFMATPKFS